jgi:hypothetical protein
MVKIALLWQAPAFAALVLVLMSFQDPFRLALAAAMLGFMDPVRRLILTLDPQPAARVRSSR